MSRSLRINFRFAGENFYPILYIWYNVSLMLVSPLGERFFEVVLYRTIESTIKISLPEHDIASAIGRSE